MNFVEYIINGIKNFYFFCLLNRRCDTCMGSDGHCNECDEWKNLYRRDWNRKG